MTAPPVPAIGLDRLSLNQATVNHLGLAEAAALCARHDIPAIGLWRDRVAEAGLAQAAAAIRDAGLHVSSLCRGGFFSYADAEGRRAVRADNRAAVIEAAELGADVLVLVCGGLVPGSRDLGLARRMVADGIGDMVPEAQRLGVRLGNRGAAPHVLRRPVGDRLAGPGDRPGRPVPGGHGGRGGGHLPRLVGRAAGR
jgi:sugar phosphate isomerase/epimerase